MLIEYEPPEQKPLPVPNAYDFYRQARQALVCSQQIREALLKETPVSISDQEDSDANEPVPAGVPAPGTLKRPYNYEEKKAVLDANVEALKYLQEGVKYNCVQTEETLDSKLNAFVGTRKIAQLVMLQSRQYQAAGETGKAASILADGLKYGGDIAKGGRLIHDLVSIAVQAIARKPMWELVDRLNAGDTRYAIAMIERTIDSSQPYKAVIENECFSGLTSARDMLNLNNWRKEFAELQNPVVSLPDEKSNLIDRLSYFRYYIKTKSLSREVLFDNYKKDCERAIEIASLPYCESVKCDAPTSNVLSEINIPLTIPGRFKHEYNQCLNELLLLQLALHLYKLEHDNYPSSLKNLVPEYLQNLPTDPFSNRDEYNYHLTDDKYVLYSIGPDLTDDQGRAIEVKEKLVEFKDEQGRTSKIKSGMAIGHKDKGDIVAGINII